MELTSEHVQAIFDDCLYRDEDEGEVQVVDSITYQFEFDRERLETHESSLRLMLSQMSALFFEDRGGGHTHQSLVRRRDGFEWGESLDVDKLIGLSLGLDLVAFNFPREAWPGIGETAPFVKIRGNVFRLWAVLTSERRERFCWPVIPEDFPPPRGVSEEEWYQATRFVVSNLEGVRDHVAAPLYDALVVAGHYVEGSRIPEWVKDPTTTLQVF